MSDIGEIRLGPTNSPEGLALAAQELADKENEIIRELLALASSQVIWDDIQKKPEVFPPDLALLPKAIPTSWEALEGKPSTLEHFGVLDETIGLIETQALGLVSLNDSRLVDARTPLPHEHPAEEITGGSLGVASVSAAELSVSSYAEVQELTVYTTVSTNLLDSQSISVASVGIPITAAAGSLTCPNLDADRLDGEHGAYYRARANHTGNLSYTGMPLGTGTWDTGPGTTATILRNVSVAGNFGVGAVLTVGTTSSSHTIKGETRFEGSAASSNTESFFVTGEAILRAVTKASGSREIGSGTASRDLRVGRSAVSTLTIDTPAGAAANLAFAGQLRVTTTAATVLGAVIGRYPLYNAAGTLIGYLPIYDTIT